MKTANAGRFALTLGAAALLASRAMAAPDPVEILKKSQAAMNTAKSYQAVVEMSVSMGQIGASTMQLDIKAIPGKKMSVKSSPVGKATGMMAMQAAAQQTEMYDDGKTMYAYSPAMKVYRKQPSQAAQTRVASLVNIPGLTADGKPNPNAAFKYLRAEKVGGKSAHVIQVIPKTARPNAGKEDVLIYVDQATNRLIQVKMTGSQQVGPNQPPVPVNISIVIKSEKLNAAIPDNAFKFTPPAGVKEFKGGPGPGMMPGMGAPGGARPPR